VKLLRKIFLLTLLACCLLFGAVAQAAQVTDVKWGVSKDNVLRFVVDVTDTAGYAVDIDESNLKLTVNAKKSDKAPDRRAVKSMVADSLQVLGKGSNTVVQVPLKQKLTAKDYKAFVLKKDAKTGRPFRVVLDITQPSQQAAVKSTTAGVVVSNKPVVSNRPTKVNTAASAAATAKKQTTTVAASEAKSKATAKKTDAKKTEAKKTDSKRATAVIRADGAASTGAAAQVAVVKGNGKFRTGGGISGKVITLDAGHGGSDPGAIGSDGTKEKNITLPITKMVKELLEAKGAKVYMTRTTDVDVYGPNASDVQELQARVNVGEKYNSDVFVSLHINSSVNKSVGGFSSYYYPKTANDLKLAKSIQNQLTANFGVDDLGVRQANFYVIKRISMPATLIEMCFISNEKELTLMKGAWFQKKAARLIADGIEKYFA
jgi:N-acetylmuramoyl-L-alanine amidase